MNIEEFKQRHNLIKGNENSYVNKCKDEKSVSRLTIEEFKARRKKIQKENEVIFANIEKIHKEEQRIIKVLHDAAIIFNDLDKCFEQKTSIKKHDWPILILATGLQLLRIYLLPKYEEKIKDENRIEHDDSEMKDYCKNEKNKYAEEHENWKSKKSEKYRSWQSIVFEKVPYDATAGSPKNNINMHGGQHRVKALGHDPILGWIFGVCNIITDTITVAPEYKYGEKKIRIPYLKTYNVQMKGNFCWTDKVPTYTIFKNSIESINEDKHRLPAAIFAQGLHLTSDKYSTLGLPIPFLSLIDADKAYEIYKNGYDYLDLKHDIQIPLRTFSSVAQAILINKIISLIHMFFYNPQVDPDQKLYSVRTRKIVLYSNIIATTSDVIRTAIRASVGDKTAWKDFDLGGFFVTLYRLCTDVAFIQQVQEEFIFREWEKIFDGSDNILKI